jgi:hypothetical protein
VVALYIPGDVHFGQPNNRLGDLSMPWSVTPNQLGSCGLVLFPNNSLISVVFREIITRLMLFPNHFLISVVFRDTGLGLFPNHFLISAVFRERGIRNTRSR